MGKDVNCILEKHIKGKNGVEIVLPKDLKDCLVWISRKSDRRMSIKQS